MNDPYVLVGVDDRPDAVTTARVGVEEARLRGLDLVLAFGYADLPVRLSAPGGAELDRHGRAAQALRSVAAHLVLPARTRIELVSEPVEPLTLLTRLGARADRIVLGQHHLGIRERVPEPSLGSRLSASVDRAMVFVPGRVRAEPAARAPIVVALDGEAAAGPALALAFDEAELRRRPILALHAESLQALPADRGDDERDLAEILAGWKADHPDVPVRTLVCPAEPTDLIVQVSRDAPLMVVGRPHGPGHGGWSRSVAAAVQKLARCPLVIAPPQPEPSRQDRGQPAIRLSTNSASSVGRSSGIQCDTPDMTSNR